MTAATAFPPEIQTQPGFQGQPIAHSISASSKHRCHWLIIPRQSSSACLIRAVRECHTLSSVQASVSPPPPGWGVQKTAGGSPSVLLVRAPVTPKTSKAIGKNSLCKQRLAMNGGKAMSYPDACFRCAIQRLASVEGQRHSPRPIQHSRPTTTVCLILHK